MTQFQAVYRHKKTGELLVTDTKPVGEYQFERFEVNNNGSILPCPCAYLRISEVVKLNELLRS